MNLIYFIIFINKLYIAAMLLNILYLNKIIALQKI